MTTSRATGARTLLQLREWIPSRLTLLGVAALSLAGGLLEALIVGLVAGIGAAVAQGQDLLEMSLGPVDMSVTTTRALAVGFVATAVMVMARLTASVLGARLASRTLVNARRRLLEGYLSASYEVQRTVVQAELHDLIAFQAMRMSQAVLTVTTAVTHGLSFIALVAVAVLFDPLTAGMMLALSIVLAAVFLPMVRRSNRAGQNHLDAQVQVGVELGDVTGLLAEVHVYGGQQGMMARLAGSIAQSGRAFRTAAVMAQLTPTLYLAAVLTLLLSALLALSAVGVSDLQTVGAIALLMLRGLRYSQQLQSQFQVAVEHAPDVVSLSAALRRFRDSAAPDHGDDVERVDTLEFQDVTYHHPGTTEGVDDVSVALRRGEVVGVVGHSGAGKSTFAELTLGLRQPTRGRVLVNDRPRSDFRLGSWYRRVAYVGQESRLLAGNVADNVAFFRDLGDPRVQAALAAASLGEDLQRWEHGDQREVGAGGRDVSGGQRQRIAIARALVGDPDVIVMDEPTSALDPESERRIRESVAALAGHVLVIVVAHRHSTLDVCDRILQFEDGRLRELAPGALGEVPM